MSERCGKWMPRAQAECVLRDGHSGPCQSRNVIYFNENKEQINVRRRAHYAANRERITARNRAWHAANADRVKAQKRIYTENNPHIAADRTYSGRSADAQARYKRRKADERDGNIDPRLETELGGLLCPD